MNTTIEKVIDELVVETDHVTKGRILINKIKEDLKMSWVKEGHLFADNPAALMWSGEGATIVDSEMPDMGPIEAFDYYGEEPLYVSGVHKAVEEWSKKHGITWEPYDPGTFLAYKA